MPLPFIIGGVALATAAFGVKKASDGHEDMSRAKRINEDANELLKKAQEQFEAARDKEERWIKDLGKEKIRAAESFEECKKLAIKILKALNNKFDDHHKIDIPVEVLQEINVVTMSLSNYVTTFGSGAVAGAAVAYAAYGGVMALGTASTGTAIATLSGAAAVDATLAALGGGSLAAGGLGVMGGTAILGAAVAGPALAVMGWSYSKKGEEALEHAREHRDKAEKTVSKYKKITDRFEQNASYAYKVEREIRRLYNDHFQPYFTELKKVNDLLHKNGRAYIQKMGQSDPQFEIRVRNGLKLMAVIGAIINTPLFKSEEKDGKLQAKQDEYGKVLNSEVLDNNMGISQKKYA